MRFIWSSFEHGAAGWKELQFVKYFNPINTPTTKKPSNHLAALLLVPQKHTDSLKAIRDANVRGTGQRRDAARDVDPVIHMQSLELGQVRAHGQAGEVGARQLQLFQQTLERS